MATSCLFAAAVIAVISSSNVHAHYGHKLFIIAPVSNQNGGQIYWSLHPIERRNREEEQRCTEDDNVETMNSKKHEDYSGDRLMSRRYFEAVGIFPRDDGTRTWDGRENLNEHNGHSHKRNPHYEHKVRNIKNDYVEWKKMRENKSLYEGYRSLNEEQLNDDDSLTGAVIKRGNRNRDQAVLVWGNNLLADIGGSTIKKDDNMFVEDEMWQQQLGDEHLQRPLSKVRKKRSPKMTRAKIMKRQRRKKRRKEIRQQRKRMRIIKHDPEDDKFVASKEEKKPTITYDYSTHEERPRNDLDEEFVSKMPRRGELGEFGEGSDESDEDENKAKEVTDDDKKKQKNKKDDDKEKKGGDKRKGRKDDKKPKGKKGGNKGKAKKSGSKKGGKKGKKERGKGKKRKAAGRDTKGKHMLTDRNLQNQHDAVNYGQHKSVDRSRASVANQHDVVRLQQNPLFANDHVEQRVVTQEHHKTVFNKIQLSASGNGIDHPQWFFQKQIGNADALHTVANIKQITRNKDTKISERDKVLADFRKIFGQKNTVKLLMDKYQSRLNNNIINNNNKASLHFANNNAVNKVNTIS